MDAYDHYAQIGISAVGILSIYAFYAKWKRRKIALIFLEMSKDCKHMLFDAFKMLWVLSN